MVLSFFAAFLCSGCTTQPAKQAEQYYQGRLVTRTYYDRNGALHYVLGATRAELALLRAGLAQIKDATKDVVVESP